MSDQKLIDMCFQIGIVMSDPKFRFHTKTTEKRAEWIANTLKSCGYPTIPCGASWGVLVSSFPDKASVEPVVTKTKKPLSSKARAKQEKGRDLLAEINEGVDAMLAGAPCRTRVVEVSARVHAKRKSVKKDVSHDTDL
jgi:hypothetical protein